MNTQMALKYLALGLSPAQVASIVGVSPSRISQLLSCETTKAFLAKASAEKKEDQEVEVLENKEMAAKHMLLGAILERTGEASFMELARAYEIISRAPINRNPILSPGQNIFSGTIVQISVPARSLPEIQITKDKEVIAIGERALAPLPAAQVTNLFSRMRGEQNEQICLPSGPEESDSGSLPQETAAVSGSKIENREMIRRRPWLCQLFLQADFLVPFSGALTLSFSGAKPSGSARFSSFFWFDQTFPFLFLRSTSWKVFPRFSPGYVNPFLTSPQLRRPVFPLLRPRKKK